MSKIKFVYDKSGLIAFRQSNEIKALVKAKAEEMATKDQHILTFIGFDRAKSIIYPNTRKHPS